MANKDLKKKIQEELNKKNLYELDETDIYSLPMKELSTFLNEHNETVIQAEDGDDDEMIRNLIVDFTLKHKKVVLKDLRTSVTPSIEPTKKVKIIEESIKVDEAIQKEKADNSMTIEEAFDAFIEDQKKQVGNSRIKAIKTAYKYLTLFFSPQKKVTTFTSKDFKEMLKKMTNMPTNFFKMKHLQEMLIDDVLGMTKDEDKLNPKTINNYFEIYKKIFAWLEYEEEIEENKNPALKVEPLKETKADRTAYTDKDIVAILKADTVANDVKKFFLIALYSGMRIGEIISVKKEDVFDTYINIPDAKTTNGIRRVPIHSKIKDMIFKLKKTNRTQYLIGNGNINSTTKRINRHIRTVIKAKNKTFHSTRKNFIQALIANEITMERIQVVVGHSTADNLTLDIYGENKIPIEHLIKAVETVNYGEIGFED